MPNRLAAESSPYLRQHQDNPVDWYPWGEDAFERARSEDKPIFLSIGYSTCHWCHVMAHESFENAAVAEVLNRLFVPVKVDREERPDVDRVYMTFVQATTGSGGWPMSVWLTPALEPFYGGTYFPPESRWGRPGFVDVLHEVARVWRDERDRVTRSASAIMERLQAIGRDRPAGEVPGTALLERTAEEFAAAFDVRRGGFGPAPKFPRPSELLFLLREGARTGRSALRDMAAATLLAMARGGMRDHLGGGFHRYSVDAEWRVPHFEKMLYDQAQLVLAYLEAAQATGDPFHAGVARDTLEYVARDLTHPEGGFYSAEDADSVPPEAAGRPGAHPSEGAFYIWRDAEIGELLGEDAAVFRLRFGVLPDGNAPFDPQGEFTGRNLLYTARSVDEVAALTGRTAAEVEQCLLRSRARLLARRSTRPRPHLDDKIITAWNGLMIAAFARAARVLDEGVPLLASATQAARFIRRHLWKRDERILYRRHRAGQSGVAGYAEDYASLVSGLVELFQADGDPAWLEWAIELQRRLDELFWDEQDGGWFSTTGADPSVLLRLKEEYDGAEPAPASLSALNLIVLGRLVPDAAREARLERALARAPYVAGSGRAMPLMLAALSAYHAGVAQVVLVEGADPGHWEEMAAVVRSRYLPTAVVVPVRREHRAALQRIMSWIASMPPRERETAAYVCRDFTCRMPVASPEALAVQLDDGQAAVR